ncbi:unnamed protein product [Mortierella alpina]
MFARWVLILERSYQLPPAGVNVELAITNKDATLMIKRAVLEAPIFQGRYMIKQSKEVPLWSLFSNTSEKTSLLTRSLDFCQVPFLP